MSRLETTKLLREKETLVGPLLNNHDQTVNLLDQIVRCSIFSYFSLRGRNCTRTLGVWEVWGIKSGMLALYSPTQ